MLTITEIHTEQDYTRAYEITAVRDEKQVLGFSARDLSEDCPEDATLSRSMRFAYKAIEFFKLGYEAGKNGEEVNFEELHEKEKDFI